MKELDLHGIKHEEVERLLENFILLNNPPLKVITGNSDYMRRVLERFCIKHKVNYERWVNWGGYTILVGYGDRKWHKKRKHIWNTYYG